MTRTRIATALVLIGVAFILYIGLGYVLAPNSMAPGFGLPAWPQGESSAFMTLKGVRDISSGVVLLALLLTRQRFALGIAMLAVAVTPVGDMLTVLNNHGSVTTALSVHGLTAALVAATGVLLVRERSAESSRDTVAAVPVTAVSQ
ncbi:MULTISPECIES: DUF4267 domain-containing protein [Nocardia]|jgi:hypothetical protein|uniref:DUF4267 domain-containing protein n=2 Tax=Nocardia TaxID=1817 RepID=A0A2T2Z3M6_9NOCA|nr:MULTISPECIES: DUF4267 domain-containing protein [Nocardia]OBF86532.1 small membrane hydrophobic protein [Mycobacterium sp. 852002-51759_SCH5129042]MBF6243722.1 DUF4267 domain-containing protein [Nocardia elegans]MBF6275537.1 DUF4267 domain-containing protein [Nocardia nova]MBF6448903.1 DUF4267 domain-containing protein [Nocardia elegans]MBV7704756.1 DUF4267 domain-containing protein [Nocardia nova]